jgi:L-histidine Nalpha-methyltransferase / hercynylcysteine S-oxide synthase
MTESALTHYSSSISLRIVLSAPSPDSIYTLYALEYPSISFAPLSSQTSETRSLFGVPSLDEWRRLWAAWDLVTVGMVPESMLHRKPIDLRHKVLFYTGHIPT